MSAEEITKRLEEIGADDYNGPVYPKLELKTSRIAYVLLAGEPGDVILDEEWPDHLKGVAPSGKSYSTLMSAGRYALRSQGVVWERVKGEGLIKCKTHPERVDVARSKIRGARRRAQVAVQVLGSTDYSELSADERARANSLNVQATITVNVTAPKVTKALEARDEEQQKNYLAERVLR